MHFKANGFSPAWEAEIKGNTLTLQTPDFDSPNAKPRTLKVERSASAKETNYTGHDGATAVALTLAAGPCEKATEGGQPREFHATLHYGKSTYNGCADATH